MEGNPIIPDDLDEPEFADSELEIHFKVEDDTLVFSTEQNPLFLKRDEANKLLERLKTTVTEWKEEET